MNPSSDSECESEVSVTKLKGWLDDFGKKQRNHFEKVTMIGHVPVDVNLQKPTRPKVQVMQPTRTIKRTTEQMKEARKGPAMTPVRFKSRLEDKVQATDNGYASVKELSAWLAGDPTTKKAVRGSVRRGVNVINKSRMFEKDLEDVIIEEVGLHRGDVTDKKQWLEHEAFRDNNNDNDNDSDFDRRSAVTELVSVQDKKKWLHNAFGGSSVVNGGSDVDGGRDSRTVVSVTDKREWLNKAFKKGSERMLERGANEHDSATPAKKKWQAHAKRRSSRQLGDAATSPVPRSMKDPQTTSRESTHRETFVQNAAAASINGARQAQPAGGVTTAVEAPHEASAGASRSIEATEAIRNDANNQNQQPQSDNESPAYDFKTARQLLVQRSAANGNPVKVLTKVQMKKNKFERLQKEVLKGTGPKGLLKPSWEQGSGIEKPADQYVKTFIPDIAPKKSFEELP
jgi:hypothetical protein